MAAQIVNHEPAPIARHAYEVAESLGITLEDLVGAENAHKYPRNRQEAEFIHGMRKLAPLDRAVIRAMLVGARLGFLDSATRRAATRPGGNLEVLREWCDRLTAAQRAAIEAEWDRSAEGVA